MTTIYIFFSKKMLNKGGGDRASSSYSFFSNHNFIFLAQRKINNRGVTMNVFQSKKKIKMRVGIIGVF